MRGGKRYSATERFRRDLARLPPDIRSQAIACIEDLLRDPIPAARRAHRINATSPKVFSADVTSNKAYKLSFTFDGEEVMLRRVATHREIDRDA